MRQSGYRCLTRRTTTVFMRRAAALAGGLQEDVPSQLVQLNRNAFPTATGGSDPRGEGAEGAQVNADEAVAMVTEEGIDSAEEGDAMSVVSSLTTPSVKE